VTTKRKAASIELGSRGEDCRGIQETVSAVVVATGVVLRRAAERKDNRHACGERLDADAYAARVALEEAVGTSLP